MKNLICRLIGHNKKGRMYSYYDFGDGKQSWGTICPRCDTLLYCIKGYVKTEPAYVCSAELSDQSENAKQEMMRYPLTSPLNRLINNL